MSFGTVKTVLLPAVMILPCAAAQAHHDGATGGATSLEVAAMLVMLTVALVWCVREPQAQPANSNA